MYSVTRLSDFWNFLVAPFIAQVTQMFGDFLGSFENHCFLSPTGEPTFGASFWKNLGYFYFNIWSHCLEGLFM